MGFRRTLTTATCLDARLKNGLLQQMLQQQPTLLTAAKRLPFSENLKLVT